MGVRVWTFDRAQDICFWRRSRVIYIDKDVEDSVGVDGPTIPGGANVIPRGQGKAS